MSTLQVLILGVTRYNFEDRNSGNTVKGVSVHYCQLNHLNENDRFGYLPTKANLPYEQFENFQGLKFPVRANAEWTMDLANKRNPIKITGFSDLIHVDIDSELTNV